MRIAYHACGDISLKTPLFSRFFIEVYSQKKLRASISTTLLGLSEIDYNKKA